MEKKMYQKPVMRVVNIRTVSLLSGSPVGSVGGNTGLKYGGASSNAENPVVRSRQGSVWADDEDWDD